MSSPTVVASEQREEQQDPRPPPPQQQQQWPEEQVPLLLLLLLLFYDCDYHNPLGSPVPLWIPPSPAITSIGSWTMNAQCHKCPFKHHHMGVSLNGGFSPQIIHFNRVFHYFHHPFWGTPILGNSHIYKKTQQYHFKPLLWKKNNLLRCWVDQNFKKTQGRCQLQDCFFV